MSEPLTLLGRPIVFRDPGDDPSIFLTGVEPIVLGSWDPIALALTETPTGFKFTVKDPARLPEFRAWLDAVEAEG